MAKTCTRPFEIYRCCAESPLHGSTWIDSIEAAIAACSSITRKREFVQMPNIFEMSNCLPVIHFHVRKSKRQSPALAKPVAHKSEFSSRALSVPPSRTRLQRLAKRATLFTLDGVAVSQGGTSVQRERRPTLCIQRGPNLSLNAMRSLINNQCLTRYPQTDPDSKISSNKI